MIEPIQRMDALDSQSGFRVDGIARDEETDIYEEKEKGVKEIIDYFYQNCEVIGGDGLFTEEIKREIKGYEQ